ncbi:type II toxin-antitoxin system RelE/ParE family toxin [Burkholderia cepacia]|uniref:type II toxin-antitoxin system RelE/ParE family toxin n=1 Tax=Burkholderia cepacia TaxID=292 RepID=UPI000CF05746|nr:type II toxin-antitoxin system RelE/ParE family toxin [Burkholderia cepacia]
MEEHDADLRMPYSRAMGEGLLELRPRGREGIGRVFHCIRVGGELVVLHSFVRKTQETPNDELHMSGADFANELCRETAYAATTLAVNRAPRETATRPVHRVDTSWSNTLAAESAWSDGLSRSFTLTPQVRPATRSPARRRPSPDRSRRCSARTRVRPPP